MACYTIAVIILALGVVCAILCLFATARSSQISRIEERDVMLDDLTVEQIRRLVYESHFRVPEVLACMRERFERTGREFADYTEEFVQIVAERAWRRIESGEVENECRYCVGDGATGVCRKHRDVVGIIREMEMDSRWQLTPQSVRAYASIYRRGKFALEEVVELAIPVLQQRGR